MVVFFFLLHLRRLSLNCWVHKRLPVCDPLSIQDQSVRGSNYCKFLSVLSTERGEGERRRKRESSGSSTSLQLKLFCSSLNSDVYFKLMKTFLSTAAFQLSRAHPTTSTLLSHPSHAAAWFAFPAELNRIRRGCPAFVEWWSSQWQPESLWPCPRSGVRVWGSGCSFCLVQAWRKLWRDAAATRHTHSSFSAALRSVS